MLSHGLLIIDMIDDFLAGLGPLRRSALIGRINALAGICRSAGAPVIWVRQVFKPDLTDAYLEMRDKGVSIAIEGTTGAEFDVRLDRRPDDIELVKKRYSAFFGTPLDTIIAEQGLEALILAGVNTHACVRVSAIDAYQRDLRVILATDCLESYDRDHAALSLGYMDGKIGLLMSNDEIAV